MKFLYSIIITLFLIPNFALASFSITEIMYDLDGGDTGREWVEIYNSGASSVDISGYKFLETPTSSNHSLTQSQGTANIPAGGYAIISNDPTKFMVDWPNFSGNLFKASFTSLNNTSGTLIIKDESLNILDQVNYSSSLGASGDGNSLQKNSSGTFAGFSPTPGSSNTSSPQNDSSSSQSSQTTTTQNNSSNSSWPVEQQIFANAGPDRVVVVGADVLFEGKALGIEKKPLENARYVWNFGDGSTKEGQIVNHTYQYPGDYVVILDISSGYFSASDRAKVQAENSKIIISGIGDTEHKFIELSNTSNYEIDVSRWILGSGTTTFNLPAHTFIAGNKKLILAKETTGIDSQSGVDVNLYYPNGTIAYKYNSLNSKAVTTEKTQIIPVKESTQGNYRVVKSVVEDEKEKVDKSDNLSATAIKSGVDSFIPTSYKWLMGLGFIALISIFGVVFSGKKEANGKFKANDFTIIERE